MITDYILYDYIYSHTLHKKYGYADVKKHQRRTSEQDNDGKIDRNKEKKDRVYVRERKKTPRHILQ